MTNPLVSISCITYNHALFIKECFEGFLMQKTDFEFEILVHDDASNDGTAEIIKEYEQKHPHLFRVIYQTENQYSKGIKTMNPRFNYPRARGKYIALCEGDDYWTDPYKLQKQVDFLEANEGYVLCTHNFKVLDANNNLKDKNENKNFPNTVFFEGLINNWNVQTATFLFTAETLKNFSSKNKYMAGDINLVYHLSEKGKIYYSNEVMSVYRQQGQGVTNMSLEKRVDFLESMHFLYQKILDSTKNIETKKAVKRLYVGNLLNLSDHYQLINRKKSSLRLLFLFIISKNFFMSKKELKLSAGIIKNIIYA